MRWVSLVLLAFCWGGAVQTSKILDALPPEWDRKEAIATWSGAGQRRLFAGYENAAADVWWLRSIQYHGGEVAFNPESKLDLLETYLDITTTLDPRFEIAYRYGAIFLSEGRFGANNPEAGIRLLEKGLKAMPNNWRLGQDRALFTSVYLKNPVLASQRTIETSKLPGAPAYLKVMAATVLAEHDGATRETARAMWKQLASSSEEEFVRAAAQRYLDRYAAIDMAEKLTELVPIYKERMKNDPLTVDDFIAAGLLRGVPRDPAGTPFKYDPMASRFRVSHASSLYLQGL